jgi:hypothetical protein
MGVCASDAIRSRAADRPRHERAAVLRSACAALRGAALLAAAVALIPWELAAAGGSPGALTILRVEYHAIWTEIAIHSPTRARPAACGSRCATTVRR